MDENYFHGGGCLAVKLPGATVSLTFNGARCYEPARFVISNLPQGSYIAYYSDLMNNHGSMQVFLVCARRDVK